MTHSRNRDGGAWQKTSTPVQPRRRVDLVFQTVGKQTRNDRRSPTRAELSGQENALVPYEGVISLN